VTNSRSNIITELPTLVEGYMLNGTIELLGQFGKARFGPRLSFFYDLSRSTVGPGSVTGSTIVDPTVTDINIEGQPSMQDISGGANIPINERIARSQSSTSQKLFLPMGVFQYDGQRQIWRAAAGPNLFWNGSNYTWQDVPVSAYGLALFNPGNFIVGANAYSHGNEFGAEGHFATTKQFQKYADFVSTQDELRVTSLMNDTLRERYIQNMYDNFVASSQGLILTLGGHHVGGKGNAAYGALSYTHQIPRMGPLGMSIFADSNDPSIRGALYLGISNGMSLMVEAGMRKETILDRVANAAYERNAWFVGPTFRIVK
jgi:hypothetical protein